MHEKRNGTSSQKMYMIIYIALHLVAAVAEKVSKKNRDATLSLMTAHITINSCDLQQIKGNDTSLTCVY